MTDQALSDSPRTVRDDSGELPGAVLAVGAEFYKGLLLARARLGSLLLSMVGTSTMYVAIQFAVGRGNLPADLIAQTLVGLAVWVLLFWAGSAMVGDLVEEARSGTLDQLRMSPAPLGVSVLGRLGAALVQGGGAAVVVLLGNMALLGAPFPLSLAGLVPLSLTALSALGFTAVLAGLSLRFPAWRRMTTLVVGLVGMINGAFLPVALFPTWLQVVAHAVPTTTGIELVRRSAPGGEPLAALWADGSLAYLFGHVGLTVVAGYGLFAAAARWLARTGGVRMRSGRQRRSRHEAGPSAPDPSRTVHLPVAARSVFGSFWRPLTNEIHKGLLISWRERAGFLVELAIFLVFFALVNMYLGRGRIDVELLAGTLVGMVVVAFFHRQVSGVFWSLQEEIQTGTIEQLYLSPAPPTVLLLAREVVAIVEGALFAASLWLLVNMTWQVPLHPLNLNMVLPVASIVIGAAGFALTIAGLALCLRKIDLLVQLVFGAALFLGGVFLPLEQAPSWLRTTGNVVVPITRGLAALRETLLSGPADRTFDPLLVVQPLAWLAIGALVFRASSYIARTTGRLSRY